MSFEENLGNLIKRIDALKRNIQTEEATKTSLIMPFFAALGYDVFNPIEFIPEFTADYGIKKGEKVDYAIRINDEIQILIEAKSINENLDNHGSQLFRYFGTSSAKFGILTNGLTYRFFTDLDDKNKMDSAPFFEIDLEEMNDGKIAELQKFCKSEFDLSQILDTASDLKYTGLIKKVLKDEFTLPSDEFVRFILNQNVYDGQKNQNVIDRYKPLVKKSISQYLNDLVNDKIKTALTKEDEIEEIIVEPIEAIPEDTQIEPTNAIKTTPEELQSFYMISAIVSQIIPIDRISYKDTQTYFSIIVDGKVTRWICRVSLKEYVQYIRIMEDGEEKRYDIEHIEDIYKYIDIILKRASELV